MIGLDCETHLIRTGCLAPRVVSVQISSGDDGGRVYARPDLALAVDEVVAALEGGEVVGHNVAFDLAVVAEWWRIEGPGDDRFVRAVHRAIARGAVYDTQVRERLICVATGELEFRHGPGPAGGPGGVEKTVLDLATLARRYLGVDLSAEKSDPRAWRLRYAEIDGVPVEQWPPEAVSYAALDAVYAVQILGAQWASVPELLDGYPTRAEDGRHLAGEVREIAAAWALHLEAAWGLRSDADRVRAAVAEWDRGIAEGRVVAQARGLVRANGTADTKAIRSAVEAALGPATPRTGPSRTFPAGQIKIDAATLRETGDPALRAYADAAHLGKLSSVWGDPLDRASRTPLTSRPTHLVETGRTSWSDPPLQQPPREGGVRECFVPRPGWVYCSVDFDTIELCALAQICTWIGAGSAMADAINAGRDLHLETAAALLTATGMPETYDGALLRYRAGDPVVAGPSGYRQIAKAPNFGLPGRLGSTGLVAYAHALYDLTISPDFADVIYRTWHARYPEVRACCGWGEDTRGEQGTVRHFVSGRLRGDTRITAACNGYFQGLVADGAKYAAWCLAAAAYGGEIPNEPGLVDAARAFHGCRPVLFLHDEILAELPESRAHEAAEAMTEIMLAAMRRHIPDVRVNAEPALMRRWLKGAKTVRDARGRLIPWEAP